ncbi:3940_t:CDS:1, partial [Funneliformis geosporum]
SPALPTELLPAFLTVYNALPYQICHRIVTIQNTSIQIKTKT